MSAREDLLKIVENVRKTADDYVQTALDLHEYADRVDLAAAKWSEADCQGLVDRLQKAVPEFVTKPDRSAN